jgi:predicted naringenin-chalcone synthase
MEDGLGASDVRIVALATSEAGDTITQEGVLDLVGLAGDEFAEGIFARCGVRERHLSPCAECLEDSLQSRTSRVESELLERSIECVDALGIDPQQVGTVISSSMHSLGVPCLAHRLADHYGMGPTTDKYHVTGVGCASAVPLMRLAAQTLAAHPGRDTLLVAADAMGSLLMPARAHDPRVKVIDAALFGDGAAAALLSSRADAGGAQVLDSQVHQVASSLDAVRLSLSQDEGHLCLARELPELVGAELPEVAVRFLARSGLERSDIDHWVVHPGGRRIIESTQAALGLSREDVGTSWEVLACHGNVGTPAVMYVLARLLGRGHPQPGERGLVVTVGPGVTIGLMLLRW